MSQKLFSLNIKFYSFVFFAFCVSFFLSCSGQSDVRRSFLAAIETGDYTEFMEPSRGILSGLLKMQDGSLYYLGLHLKKNGHSMVARDYFRYGYNHYKKPFRELCREELYNLASVDEKIEILKTKLNETNDEKARAEINKKLDICYCLGKNYKKMSVEIPVMFAKNQLDKTLLGIFADLQAERKDLPLMFFEITDARELYYNRKYQLSWNLAKSVLEKDSTVYLYRDVLSDFGRSALFANDDFFEAARIFEKKFLRAIELGATDDEILYMLSFYTARLYTKAGAEFSDLALYYFREAERYAPTDFDYDNTLWYRLITLKSTNAKEYFAELKRTIPLWKNQYWYQDLVEGAIVYFLNKNDIDNLNELNILLQQTDLNEMKAMISYILARLNYDDKRYEYFENAFDNDHNHLYYRVMSAYFLNKPIVDKGYRVQTKRNENLTSEQALAVLNGYKTYKLYDYILPQIKELYPNISSDEALEFSKVLNAQEDYASSMSVMQFAMLTEGAEINTEHLKLAYPRPWLASVKKYSVEYGVPEYIIFALMRCESFFKYKVVSHAGAVGLTQLMPATAADIARRLKIDNYDVNDPDTNIRFGVYYLSLMIKQNDNKIMQALFAYNAGPGNVRKWNKSIKNTPDDLFLEKLPFEETRNYGRRVLAASVIYARIYYNKTASEIVQEIFPHL